MGIKKKHVPGCGCCGGGVTSCGCAGSNPSSWDVTLAGITDAWCSDCDTAMNGTFNLLPPGPPCIWSYTGALFCGTYELSGTLTVQLVKVGSSVKYTVTLSIANFFTPLNKDVHIWEKTIAGSDCALSGEDIPWVSDNLYGWCTSGASSTCTLTAIP